MGKRGPKPTPRQKLKLQGTFSESRYGGTDPSYEGAVIPPPWLTGPALDEWNRLAPDLERMKLLSAGDAFAFASYCACVAEFVEAREHVEAEGAIIDGPNGGQLVNGWLAVMRKAREQALKIAAEFGMTPSARRNVHPESTEPDELEKLLARVNQ